jgi:integrase/recombinase XerD
MNRNSSGSLMLSKAITGFISYKMAEGLSNRSIDSYERILKKWADYLGEVELAEISSQEITAYLNWLRLEYVPQRFNGKKHPLSQKTLRNIWVTLSAFFSWARQDLRLPSPMVEVPAPKFKKAPVHAFTQDEVEKMLKACAYSREANTETRHKFNMRRPTAHRDQAIILMLLDTGMRAMELCSLTIEDVDIKTGKVEIKHGIKGGAKGGKGRTVYLGKVSRKAIWRYLAEREDGEILQAPVFVSRDDRPFNPDTLRQLVKSIGDRAGVPNAYTHKFRHTFAITYLRSGGDVFTLQALLGHNSLDMVRHYARIADIDVANAHRRASPADNWRL